MNNEIRITLTELDQTFTRILRSNGFDEDRAARCAEVFTNNSIDGVYTHGVNRFPRFISSIADGQVYPMNDPVKVGGNNALEQWNGQLGAGPLNAVACTNRAMQLAEEFGIGCVALANTNHWMRGGSYGWQAAKKGYAFICWTNTIANMPAWGASDSRLGNNPLIIAVPRNDEAVVLDMAISQFSFGAMEKLELQGKKLPVIGGYDDAGNMTNDPAMIIKTNRSLPVGYWKGSGLALLLDLLAAMLSGGKTTAEISAHKAESALSQVFIAFKLSYLQNAPSINQLVNSVIDDYKAATPDGSGNSILYPGERVLQTREDNLLNGIPVNTTVWSKILGLL